MLLTVRCQLNDFLAGGRFGAPSSPDLADALQHCPVTNLIGENAFGDLDFDMNKRRHASFHHRSSTQMWKHNKTGKWLSGKEEKDQSKLLSLARKHGKNLRFQHKEQERLVMLKIREKLLENQRQQLLKEAKAAEKRLVLVQSVRAHGGPCESKEDVKKLKRRLKDAGKKLPFLKNAFKNEIRYQKLVLKSKGSLKLSGTLNDLISALQDHLPDQTDHAAVPASPVVVETRQDGPKQKRQRLDTTAASASCCQPSEPAVDSTSDDKPFTFSAQGQWVATYYDDNFYVGQVIEVCSPQSGIVQYLQRTKARDDSFRWPIVDDVALTEAHYIFEWDFEVVPTNRLWVVPVVDDLEAKFNRIVKRSQQ